MEEHPGVPDKVSESPALSRQSRLYPPNWHGRVPLRVRMLRTVRSDLPLIVQAAMKISHLVAREGKEYPVTVNMHGAVAVVFADGETLGLKPTEFEVTEWHPQGFNST